jgi:hypothetical protein
MKRLYAIGRMMDICEMLCGWDAREDAETWRETCPKQWMHSQGNIPGSGG